MKIMAKNKSLAALLLAGTALTQAVPSAAQDIMDVLVLYTPEATATSSGRDMDARAASYIEYANQAYANSNVNARLRLVGLERLDAGYKYVDGKTLDQLRVDSQVAALRRQYGADMVTLLNLATRQSSGYLCGIGYMPGGSESSGQFYRNAAGAAFSLVGIDCGLSTFSHELGHNMGLGHSYRQNSVGGVYDWGRGHGVDGLFSTIMAYPQSYGTRSQLQYFSNPALFKCYGQSCGVDRSRNDGADASESLNRLVAQVSAFSPTIVPLDDTGNGSGDSPTTTSACEKQPVAGNLIVNGEFDSLDAWQSAFGLSELAQDSIVNGCSDALLVVGNRSQYYSAVYQSLAGKISAGTTYTLQAKLGIRGSSRETVRIAFKVENNGQVSYQYADPASVTSSELTAISREVTFDTASVTGMIVYGPPAGVDILIDSISLVAKTPAQTPADTTPNGESQLLVNEQFELNASGWSGFYGTRLYYSKTASSGSYSLLSTSRSSVYSGPMMDITGLFASGVSYHLALDARVDGSSNAQQFSTWIYYEDDQGGHWQNLVSETLPTGDWQPLSSDFVLNTVGDIAAARLHFLGPDAAASIRIDNLRIQE